MITIIELQAQLQKLTNSRISFTDIGKALGTGRANISKRVKTNSFLKNDEILKAEKYFNVSLEVNKINSKQNNTSTDKFINIPYWEYLPENMKHLEVDYIPVQRKVIEVGWKLNPEMLRIVPMVGDKMTAFWYHIGEDDLLIIDTSQNIILGNGVYFATSRNNTMYWIREMQNLVNGDVQIKGYSPSGETVKTFNRVQLEEVDFKIIGKVIKNVSFRL